MAFEGLTDKLQGAFKKLNNKGKLNEDGSLNLNPNSLVVLDNVKLEAAFADAKPGDKFQFLRNGFFCMDVKDSTPEKPVFNRIVSLKSSYKPA